MAIWIEGQNDYPYRDRGGGNDYPYRDRGGTTMAIAIGRPNEYGYSDSDVVDTACYFNVGWT